MSGGHPALITGVVRDESGAPVEDARVYFTDTPAATPDVAALTDADGGFSLAAPVEGTYTVECGAEGFAMAGATVASRDGARMELTLHRQ